MIFVLIEAKYEKGGNKMAAVFNADEIFEMAIRIENNGAAFYRKAASLQSNTK
ncbi:hypothetical protein GWO25_02155, partial [Candidatus Saccharibacteria bacterium]|nr:hypothetical protein [Candidatus Saccharibacteria bacterium]